MDNCHDQSWLHRQNVCSINKQNVCSINRQKVLKFPPGRGESQIRKCFMPAEESLSKTFSKRLIIKQNLSWGKCDFSFEEKRTIFFKTLTIVYKVF